MDAHIKNKLNQELTACSQQCNSRGQLSVQVESIPDQQIIPFRVGWNVRVLRYRTFECACHEHDCHAGCVQHDYVVHRGAK